MAWTATVLSTAVTKGRLELQVRLTDGARTQDETILVADPNADAAAVLAKVSDRADQLTTHAPDVTKLEALAAQFVKGQDVPIAPITKPTPDPDAPVFLAAISQLRRQTRKLQDGLPVTGDVDALRSQIVTLLDKHPEYEALL